MPEEDMYDDAPDGSTDQESPSAETKGGETALIPKSLCPGMKAGDEIKLNIVSVQDDSYQVDYAKEGEAEEAMEEEAPERDQEMSEMYA